MIEEWATITEKAHQNGTQVLSRTVTSMDDQVNEATDAWYRTSSGGSSSVSESGASEASNYSESEDGGDYTHTTESKRNGTAKETLSRKANSTRETTLDTSESNSTVEGSYYNHVKDSSHIHADGTSTTLPKHKV